NDKALLEGSGVSVLRAGDGRNEAVTEPRKRFNIARILGGIAEKLTQCVDRRVQAVVVADVRVRPKLLAQGDARNHLAWTFEKELQNAEGLFRQTDAQSVLTKFATGKINVEIAKTQLRLSGGGVGRRRKCANG